MFDRRNFYSRSASWRDDPPTPSQLRTLKELGSDAQPETKGAASDAISRLVPVDEEEDEFLRVFGIKTEGLSQYEARFEIERIISDEANRTKWDRWREKLDREALKKDISLIIFVEGKPPDRATREEITKIIDSYDSNPAKRDRVREYHKLEEDRENLTIVVDEFHEELNASPDLHGIKGKISKKLVKQAVHNLRSRGQLYDELSELDVAAEIRVLEPERASELAIDFPHLFRAQPNDPLFESVSKSSPSRGLRVPMWLQWVLGLGLLFGFNWLRKQELVVRWWSGA